MTADITTAQKIAAALRANDMIISKAAKSIDMPVTTFRRHRDANAALIDELLNENAEAAPETVETVSDAEIAELLDAAQTEAAETTVEPAPTATPSQCDKPGCDTNGQCCGHDDCGECNNDGHLDTPEKPQPAPQPRATDEPVSPLARKRAVASALVTVAGDLLATWDHAQISRDEATAVIAKRMNRLPGNVWDDRIGQRPGTASAPAAPAVATVAKETVAALMITRAADLASTWEHDDITRDDATALIAQWMNYLPGTAWDARLGQRSGAGRRSSK